jgi:hypothetical protein
MNIATSDLRFNRRHAPSSTYHTNGDEFALWLSAFSDATRLVNTGVLERDTLERMWTPAHKASDIRETTLGWSRTTTDEGVLLGHVGSDDGFRSEMAVFETRDAGYGFMTNMEAAPTADISQALRRAAADLPLPQVPGPSMAMKAYLLYSKQGTEAVINLFGDIKAKDDGAMMFAIYLFSKDLFLNNNFSDAGKMAAGMIAHYPDHPVLRAFLVDTRQATEKRGL